MARPSRVSTPTTKAFAERLSDLVQIKKSEGLSHDEISRQIGVSSGVLSEWMSDNKTASIENLAKLAKYFNVSTDYLLGLSDVQTADMDVKAICEYTGLTAAVVVFLNTMFSVSGNNIDDIMASFYRRFFDDIVSCYPKLDSMCNNILVSAQANAVANVLNEPSEDSITFNINGDDLLKLAQAERGDYPIPARKAAKFFLMAAQEIATSNINQILADMMDDISEDLENYFRGDNAENIPHAKWPLKGM